MQANAAVAANNHSISKPVCDLATGSSMVKAVWEFRSDDIPHPASRIPHPTTREPESALSRGAWDQLSSVADSVAQNSEARKVGSPLAPSLSAHKASDAAVIGRANK